MENWCKARMKGIHTMEMTLGEVIAQISEELLMTDDLDTIIAVANKVGLEVKKLNLRKYQVTRKEK